MGKVSAGATMSLDGFIAGPEDTGFDLLFQARESATFPSHSWPTISRA